MLTPEWILNTFKEQASEIWGEEAIRKIDFDIVIRNNGTMMSLAYSSRPKAFGNRLYIYPKHMRLYVRRDVLRKNPNYVIQFLRHEALHIGYPTHNEDFRRMCKDYNIPITEMQNKSHGFRVQKKIGSRYKTKKICKSLQEARIALVHMRKPNERWRIIY